MLTPSEVLLQTLEDLGSEDFKVFKWLLQQNRDLEDLPWIPKSLLEAADRVQTVDQIMKVYGLCCIQVTKNILVKMNKNQLALELSQFPYKPEEISAQYQRRCQNKLREKFEKVSASGGTKLLSEVYTELYLSPVEPRVQQEAQHEVQQIQTRSNSETGLLCTDLFRGQSPAGGHIRAVLTKGVAGVGKTVLTQKFSLDWAEGRANQELHLLFLFTFRELNKLRDTQFSLVELLHFFSPSKGLCSFQQLQVLFIFDGLDECRLPLDFDRTRVLSDPTESVSVDVLLVNLIRGNLLPSARLWITTRPAAANQIPAECVSMVTEVGGFTNLQKEQYFMKRFRDEQQATAVISHIKSIRSLYIMCYIPVFCWILSTVIQKLLEQTEESELPQTLTNLYIHFLVVQLKQKNVKYDKKQEAASAWSPENREMVQSLGKLAFEQLQKGNLIFYDFDLSECGLDAAAASVYSGVLTDVFRDESGLYEDQVYCFIHLSVQEFLAALHVHQTFISSGKNLLLDQRPLRFSDMFKTPGLYRSAVDQALQSPNGHLDLFLRFLLGLSLEENQRLLGGCEPKGLRRAKGQETVKLLKKRIEKCGSVEKSLNLFHCLNELNDRSLVQEIQENMKAGRLSDKSMSPAQWSALSFLLLSSDSDLDEFDLRKYQASETALLGLLPVVKASTKALLSGCGLSSKSCGPLASVLSSSSLTYLDLSNNDLQDSGVKQLCEGLKSAPCRLETLRLCGCGLSEQSGELLSSVLSLNSSLKELDLSSNLLRDPGLKLLCEGLRAPHCPLLKLRLSCCGLTEDSGDFLSRVLQTGTSRLIELDLKHNYLREPGARPVLQDLPFCSLHTLSLASCGLLGDCCGALSTALESALLKVLDVSNNRLKDQGLKSICTGLGLDSGLETLRLSGCALSPLSCAPLASVLSSSRLTHLDLSNNDLQDSGVKQLCEGLKSAPCRLDTLRLAGCKVSWCSCGPLGSLLALDLVKELDLSNNDLQDCGLKELVSALDRPHCALDRPHCALDRPHCALDRPHCALDRPHCALDKLRLSLCGLSSKSCVPLASVLSSSRLTLLDLSNNDLQDSGVELLCSGLKSALCRLETLSLSGCLVSEEGCKHLVSALNSNPSHLMKLDLSYNHPGETGAQLLQALTRGPRCRLSILRTDHSGPQRLTPGLRKYLFCPSVDLNTLHPQLHVSADGGTVRCEEHLHPYPQHPGRFDDNAQVLFSEPLIGRCFLELECRGLVMVAVSYREIQRKGKVPESKFGGNRSSWALFFSGRYFSVWHDARHLVKSEVQDLDSEQVSRTLGLYVDSECGVLCFYLVHADGPVLLHRLTDAFTEPLFAGLRFWVVSPGSSATLPPRQ